MTGVSIAESTIESGVTAVVSSGSLVTEAVCEYAGVLTMRHLPTCSLFV